MKLLNRFSDVTFNPFTDITWLNDPQKMLYGLIIYIIIQEKKKKHHYLKKYFFGYSC